MEGRGEKRELREEGLEEKGRQANQWGKNNQENWQLREEDSIIWNKHVS